MYRNYFELEAIARHRIAEITEECQRCAQVDGGRRRSHTLLTYVRQHLGIALIQLGQALAGQEARRSVGPRPTRPAIWGQQSF